MKREHVDSLECWCEPYCYHHAENGNAVWVHRQIKSGCMDAPPPEVLSLAVRLADAEAKR